MEIPLEFQDILRPHLPFSDTGLLVADEELAGLGLDSMGLMALLADLEDRYDMELPDDFVAEATFATVGSLWGTLAPLVEDADGDR